MSTTPQSQVLKSSKRPAEASEAACSSPYSPLPEQLFRKMREMNASRQSSQELDPAIRPHTLLGIKLQNSSESSPCSLIASPVAEGSPASPQAPSSRGTDADTHSQATSACSEYEEWALHQINEARANPCIKMKVARNENGHLSLQATDNSPAAIKELRNWLASAAPPAPIEEGRHLNERDHSLIPAGLQGVKIFSSEAHSLAKTVSLSSVESLQFVDPEVAHGGFWMDVGAAATGLQEGDSLDFRFSTEKPSSRALLHQGSHSSGVLLPWDT